MANQLVENGRGEPENGSGTVNHAPTLPHEALCPPYWDQASLSDHSCPDHLKLDVASGGNVRAG
jgi:hypothetical protein